MTVAIDAQSLAQANAQGGRLAEVMAGTQADGDDATHISAFAEHPPEDRVDMLEVIPKVELLLDLGVGEISLHICILLQQRLEVAFAPPYRHGVALHQF